MMTKFAVAIMLLALTTAARAADADSANYFLPGCKSFLNQQMPTSEALLRGRCVGFIEGLVYGVMGRDFCPPNGATGRQAMAVVVKYIEARPERMHELFGNLAIEVP